MDRLKSVDVRARAYDDAAGVTAEFNLNLLHRINAELNGTIPAEAFRHRAIWNDKASRTEMHLEAPSAVEFTIEGQRFAFKARETIHTRSAEHRVGKHYVSTCSSRGSRTI